MPAQEQCGIVIDHREKELLLRVPGAVSANLGTGDVVIGDRIVIERKTVRDLASSIKDGRWRQQTERMQGLDWARCAVVLEGEWPTDPAATVDGVPASSLASACHGAFVDKGLSVFKTRDVSETSELVVSLARRERARKEREREREREDGAASGGVGGGGASPPRDVPRIPHKKDQMFRTRRSLAVAQLSLVPGIGARTASLLMGPREDATLFGWLVGLSERGRDLDDGGGPAAMRRSLADERVGGKRLGEKKAERIISLRFGDEEPRRP